MTCYSWKVRGSSPLTPCPFQPKVTLPACTITRGCRRLRMSATSTTAAPPLQKETKAGNYFVSNYPPYSFWKPEFAPDYLAAIERPPAPGTPLGIYTHIPFCRKRCHFCYFKVYTDKDSAAIRGYVDAVLAEFKLYAGKP